MPDRKTVSRPLASILLLFLAGSLLVSCSFSKEAPESGPGAAEAGASTAGREAGAVAEIDDPWLRLQRVSKWTGDLDGMIERGVIRLLVIHSKTFYFLDGARERGISAEFGQAFEQYLNRRLRAQHKRVSVVAIPVRRDQVIPFLVQGYGDIGTGNWTVTPEREKLVAFARGRIKNVRELVALAPGEPDLSSVDDLAGREVYVRRSSSYYQSLRALNGRFRREGKPEVRIHPADENLEDEDLLEMVNADLLPATVVDSHKWEWLWSKVFKNVKVNPAVFVREGGEVGVMVRRNSPQLMAALDGFYRKYPPGGRLFNTVINRYMKSTKWVLNANASRERKKFLAVVDYFKKYGGEYGFDYLMLAAQGYQESRLDQRAQSRTGAVGIMQLLPQTAAAPPISIPNIEQAEANIHAGVKYLRFIIEKYFNDPGIDEVNRMLFAFAAYNAGPSRVARLRRQAPNYGFDPNQWFDNVEYLVERKAGQEPVRYVANIYKYYVAYKRIRKMEQKRRQARGGRR